MSNFKNFRIKGINKIAISPSNYDPEQATDDDKYFGQNNGITYLPKNGGIVTGDYVSLSGDTMKNNSKIEFPFPTGIADYYSAISPIGLEISASFSGNNSEAYYKVSTIHARNQYNETIDLKFPYDDCHLTSEPTIATREWAVGVVESVSADADRRIRSLSDSLSDEIEDRKEAIDQLSSSILSDVADISSDIVDSVEDIVEDKIEEILSDISDDIEIELSSKLSSYIDDKIEDFSESYDEKVDSLTDRVQNIEDSLTGSDEESINGRIASLEGSIETITADVVPDIERRFDADENNIEEIRGSIGSLETNIAVVITNIETVSSNVENLKDQYVEKNSGTANYLSVNDLTVEGKLITDANGTGLSLENGNLFISATDITASNSINVAVGGTISSTYAYIGTSDNGLSIDSGLNSRWLIKGNYENSYGISVDKDVTIKANHIDADGISTRRLSTEWLSTDSFILDSNEYGLTSDPDSQYSLRLKASEIVSDSISSSKLIVPYNNHTQNGLSVDDVVDLNANSITSYSFTTKGISADSESLNIDAYHIDSDEISSTSITANNITAGYIEIGSGIQFIGGNTLTSFSEITSNCMSANGYPETRSRIEFSNPYHRGLTVDYNYAGADVDCLSAREVVLGTNADPNGYSNSFVWNGDSSNSYSSHGDGTFNINPVNGIEGVYIGGVSLKDLLISAANGTLNF